MIIVQNKLVSDELVEEHFICNLSACKGACCWEGDLGAPLDAEEIPILEQIYDKVKPFMSPAGIAAVEEQGVYTEFEPDDYATPLIDGGPCAYLNFDRNGVALCSIEQAQLAGVIDWKKPISCHLYPVRIAANEELGFEALNYDQWDICSAACTLGKSEQVPVYQFVKDAIIRKYGQDFYDELDGAAQFLKEG